MKRFIVIFIAGFLLIGAETCWASADTITVVHLNDTHAYILPFGPKDESGVGTIGGFARIATIINQIKASESNVLLLHAGDVFIGDFMFNKFIGMADLTLMKSLGFDALTLGNHEFDLTMLALINTLNGVGFPQQGFPVLSANLDFSAPGADALEPFVSPYTTKTFGSTKVGIFGLTTEETNILSFPSPVVVDTAVTRAAEAVAALKSDGCQVIILLSHIGLSYDIALAAAVPGIDIIVGGHSHDLTPVPIEVQNVLSGEKTYIVQAGAHGSHVGKLTFEWSETSGINISGFELIPVSEAVTPDPTIGAMIQTFVDSINTDLMYGDVYGTTVAEAVIDLDNESGTGNKKDTYLGNIIVDAYRAATNTDIALTANGFVAQKIWHGHITPAEIFRVVPFGYDFVTGLGFKLVTFDITGLELLKGLEFSLYNIDKEYSFLLQVSGMTYTYDSSKPVGQRTQSVMIGGQPINLMATYSITAGPFRPEFLTDVAHIEVSNIQETALLEYNVVKNYIIDHSPIDTTVARIEGRVIDTYATSIYAEDAERALPGTYSLSQNYPNPFNPITTIKYSIPAASDVRLDIFNILGQRITTLINEKQQPGEYSIIWDASNVASGIYFYRLTTKEKILAKKMVLLH